MDQWNRCMQPLIDEIDACIRDKQDEALTLRILSQKFGYSESHFSRNFRRVSGMRLRDYLRFRRLAFAPGRLFYFYYDGSRGWKYVRPVTKAAP